MVSLKKGRPTDLAPVERMCDLQRHRGPDASGVWQSDDHRVALGHRRLSIIDLSASGQQPMADAQRRFHVVFNGEIYNYLELRRELEGQGAVFRTQSDTEILLVGYRVWGLQLLDRMVGMFAFAIWDDQLKELLLARDPLGIKPLYYLEASDRLLFASEIGALRAVADVGAPDPEAIAEFLLWGSIGAPRTLHSGVRALPPGTWAKIQAGRFQAPREYYRLEDQIGRVEAMDAEEAAERGRAALRSSIKRHMVADVEVGTFLSGGVDSVALTALMSEISERPVTSVNLSFRSEMLDEAPIAEEAAALYRTKHHRIDIRVDEIQERLVDGDRDVVLHLEGQRLAQLLLRQGREVDLTDDDLLVRHAEGDLLALELVATHQDLERLDDGVGVDDLTVAHRAWGQHDLPEAVEGVSTLATSQLHSANGAGADVESDCGSHGEVRPRPLLGFVRGARLARHRLERCVDVVRELSPADAVVLADADRR